MKYYCYIFFFFLVSCKEDEKKITPNEYLSQSEIDSFNYKIIRYIQRLPKFATDENKFDAQFDDEYKKSLKECNLLYYYKDKKDTIYFAVSKIAPSIKLKKTATVGKLKFDSKDSIVYYKEEFRTWKMEPKELAVKTKLLFTEYINKNNLSKYYTINSNPEFYIEFPDERTFYDTQKRCWKTK